MLEFIDYEVYSGQENMDIDSMLLEQAIKNKANPILRLYGWAKPSLSIGRNQSVAGINKEFCKKNHVEIVRRPTGGRAVLHDNELTYSFVCSSDFLENGDSVISSYKEISGALVLGFNKLGIDLEFPENKKTCTKNNYCMALSTGADLSYKGKKLIGSAQCRKQGYILQHGSIILDIDNELVSNIFGDDNLTDTQITLKEVNPDCSIETLINAIGLGFKEKFSF